MTRTISISEYSTSEPLTLSATAMDELRAAARGMLDIEVVDKGRVVLRSRSLVGTVVTDHLRVLVTPKAGMDNVFHLLHRAGVVPSLERNPFHYDVAELNAAITAFFVAAVDLATQRGLHRWYQQEHDRLPVVRGRIDFAAQVALGGLVTPVECRFEEYTADVLHNRAVKTAAIRLLRLAGTPPDLRARLRHQLARFEEVATVPVDPAAIDRLHFTRLDDHYEPALRLAAMVLRNDGLLLATGNASASCFSIDMNAVFEKYVEAELRRLLAPELEVEGQHIGRLGDAGESTRNVSITPDLLFKRNGRPVYVGDAKYKLSNDASGKANDWYQLLAYTQGLQLPEGVLIYFDGGTEPVPRRVVVEYSEAELRTATISLTGSFAEIDRSMQQLAESIRSRICASASVPG